MDTIGQYLRQQREQKRISLETVASHTRIQSGFLEAIEADRFDQIPHAVSTQGFIRSYAQFLNLDPSEALKRFSPMVSPKAVPIKTTDLYNASMEHFGRIGNAAFTRRRVPFPHLMKTSFKTILVVALFGLFIAWLAHQDRVMPTETTKVSQKAPPALDPPAPLIKVKESPFPSVQAEPVHPNIAAEPVTVTENVPPTALDIPRLSPTVSSSKEIVRMGTEPPNVVLEKQPIRSSLVLWLEADAITWVKVVVDDSTLRDVLLQPGNKVRWEASEKFLLTVGNAGGVRAFFDGQDLGVLGRPGEVIRDRLLTRTTPNEIPKEKSEDIF